MPDLYLVEPACRHLPNNPRGLERRIVQPIQSINLSYKKPQKFPNREPGQTALTAL
jgi:hypothetical protein